ncbi:MAG TPA: hypothetical protein RMH99_01065 [Sandaracinaceae bacterium LLY-WYZ-13_1]|nr:hypothetical protein [Sandaracinaceae bacterium LLY-WYZ-13_1]
MLRQRVLVLVLVALVALVGCGPDTTWQPAFDATEAGWLMNVWGPSEDERFAVGGGLDDGTVVRFDGETWAEDPSVPDTPLLNWVYGFGPDDVHVVGNEGTILHWDGSAWAARESPTDQDLWGVWGAAPDDVYAVGGTARGPDGVPTIVHFDGDAWRAVDVTVETENVAAFFKVWGTGPDDVWVVGDRGVVMHWDGAAWTEEKVARDDLVSLWGTGPNDIVAVGGRGNGIVAHWDGTEWRSEFAEPLPGLNGVWMREPGVAHIVGLRGTVAVFDAETFEITELTASRTVDGAEVREPLDFHAIHGVGGQVVAVGGNLAFPADPRGIAYLRELGDQE